MMEMKNRTDILSNPNPMWIIQRRNSLAALSFISICLSFLFRTTCGDGEGSASFSAAAAGVTLTTGVKYSSEGGQRVQTSLSSPICQLRGKCGQEASPSTSYIRNCFCDALCAYYDDCCKDYQPPSDGGATALAYLPRGVATCQRMDDILTGYPIEVYKVSKCPKDFADREVRSQCENNVSPATSNRFFLLPVTGNTSLVLYRNIYCAICSGERQPIFWLAKLRCGSHLHLNRTSDLRLFIHAACPVDFAPVREWGGLPGDPRRCRSHIGKCDRDWREDATRQKCRQETNYVYAGNRAFRNKHCAQCNYVNETYLRCEDARSVPDVGTATDAFFEGSAPFVVTLDFNKRHAVITETKTGTGYVAETRVEFPECPSIGGVYDPFADVCRQVTCSPDTEFLGGRCVPMSTLQNDREAEEANESRDNELRHGDGDDYDDDDKENNTHVTSPSESYTSVAMDTTGGWQVVGPPFEAMRTRFVLFQMDSLQRLLSIVGTLFCLLFLVVYVVLYYLFSALRSDGANRYVVCYSVCLIVAHLLFLFVILPRDDFPGPLACFGLSIVIQYAYMTAFFWLSVMSIDVFRRLTSDAPQSVPQSADPQCACFGLFSLYAWLIPAAAMAGSTAIAVLRLDGWDQLYHDGKTRGCFVLGLSQLLLFVLPISLIVVTNVTMYVIVTCRLCVESRPIRKNPDQLRQTAKDKKRFVICVQLTVVMTTTWVMALVAYLTGLSLLWYVFIAFDTLQGLSVCLAFVWKAKVWHLFNGKKVTITKHREQQHQHQQQQLQQQPSDGIDSPMIEPFVGTPPDCSPSNSDSRLDTILRETSI